MMDRWVRGGDLGGAGGSDHAWDNTKKIQLFLLKKKYIFEKKKYKIKACHGNRIEFFVVCYFGVFIWVFVSLDLD